jgi:hypothetical protein
MNLPWGRRTREWNALTGDPNAWMVVNRLIGMNELAVRLLATSDDPNAKIVAESLGRILPWFFEDGPTSPVTTSTVKQLPPPPQSQTQKGKA